jgi:hypothetical protein
LEISMRSKSNWTQHCPMRHGLRATVFAHFYCLYYLLWNYSSCGSIRQCSWTYSHRRNSEPWCHTSWGTHDFAGGIHVAVFLFPHERYWYWLLSWFSHPVYQVHCVTNQVTDCILSSKDRSYSQGEKPSPSPSSFSTNFEFKL